ncbi:hypothetical protein D3C71_2044880 [compost metagenome]
MQRRHNTLHSKHEGVQEKGHFGNHQGNINHVQGQLKPVEKIRHPDQPHHLVKRILQFGGNDTAHGQ